MSDWETVTFLRKKPQKSALKSEQAINRARREGAAIDTQQKWGGGQNKQHVTTKNTAKLDRETEQLKHDKVSLDLGKLIQQGRQAKGWSQKDLATRCNEKPQVINDYEAGRGIPNQAVIGKIEKALVINFEGVLKEILYSLKSIRSRQEKESCSTELREWSEIKL